MQTSLKQSGFAGLAKNSRKQIRREWYQSKLHPKLQFTTKELGCYSCLAFLDLNVNVVS